MDPKHHAPVAPSGGASPATSVKLFQTLYAQLHRLAQRELRRNRLVTLGATELLHEAFLDLSQRKSAIFSDRTQFMAYAARAMRGLVIDYARQRKAQKRGGKFEFRCARLFQLAQPTFGGAPLAQCLANWPHPTTPHRMRKTPWVVILELMPT